MSAQTTGKTPIARQKNPEQVAPMVYWGREGSGSVDAQIQRTSPSIHANVKYLEGTGMNLRTKDGVALLIWCLLATTFGSAQVAAKNLVNVNVYNVRRE